MSSERNGGGIQVKLARELGFCFGVRRAVEMVERLAADGRVVTVLGSLVHNPQVVTSLKEKGVRKAASVDEVREGTLVIPSHGAPPEVFDEARRKRLNVVDATCPFVRVAQKAAEGLVAEGFQAIVVGDAAHTEVHGIVGWTGGKARVVTGPEEVANLPLSGNVGILAQTTQALGNLRAVVEQVTRQALGDVREMRVVNTICGATAARQAAAGELAREVEVLVVVGGKESANTRRLLEISRKAGAETHQVEEATELRKEWLAGHRVIGVTAGASTPDSVVDEVVERILALGST